MPKMKIARCGASGFLLLALSVQAAAQKIQLVRDIEPTPTAAFHDEFRVAEAGGWVYFARDVAGLGAELWRQPTGGGTPVLVKDIAPGPDGSWPDLLTPVGNEVFFVASDGVHGRELWKCDGTAAGTAMVAEIHPGAGGSIQPLYYSRQAFTVHGGSVYFAADDGVHGVELWKSDGTAGGTSLVVDALPGTGGGEPAFLTALGGDLYFSAFGPLGGSLWKMVGSTGGTSALRSFYSTPGALTAVGSQLFFYAAGSASQGYELWKSDGTSGGTLLVADIYPGSSLSQSSYPSLLTAVGSTLFFSATDGTHGRELWKSDGTGPGTLLVRDVQSGPSDGLDGDVRRAMASVGGQLYFSADDGSGTTLWKSDGTLVGTQPLVSGAGAPQLAGLRAVSQEAVAGASLYFPASDAAAGAELWRTDGTGPGTLRVADLAAGAAGSGPRRVVGQPGGGALFFADPGGGAELWTTSGTAGTTLPRADQVLSTFPVTPDGRPLGLFDLFGTLLFTANDGILGYEPWGSTGSAANTVPLADIMPGPGSGIWNGDIEAPGTYDLPAVRAGTNLYFTAYDASGIGLWKSDGSAPGTAKVRNFDLNGLYGWPLTGVAVGDLLYFSAHDQGAWGLWRTNGSAAGTWRVKSWFGGSPHPLNAERLGNQIFFAVSGFQPGLWRSDGTAAGTTQVLALSSASGVELQSVGETLYFSADTPGLGAELWKSDGSDAGTVLVADIRPGSAGSGPQWLVRFGNQLAFSADDGQSGRELWVSDGSVAGTQLAVDAVAGAQGSDPSELTSRADLLFFAIERPNGDVQLKTYDGVHSRTLLSFSGTAFFQGPWIQELRVVGTRRVFFRGNDGNSFGSELWSSDGTPAGTTLFDDHAPGDMYSSPTELVHSGGRLYLRLDDVRTGQELHFVNPGATAQVIGEGCSSTGSALELTASDPVLGASVAIELRAAPPLAAGLLIGGFPLSPPYNLGGGCLLHVAALTANLTVFATDPAGSWSASPVPIPSSPTLYGAQVALQALVSPTATLPLGVDLSNGVLLTLGD